MAQIVINEISQNYSYNIGNNSYACVAMPITSCWGPGFFEPTKYFGTSDTSGSGSSHNHQQDAYELMLDQTAWMRFPATQRGLESFVSTFRGPSTNYRLTRDYSYQMAMTLMTAGYDVLVCRLCPGDQASGTLGSGNTTLTARAKYPGTFGNTLRLEMYSRSYLTSENVRKYYWNLIVYSVDASGIKSSLENLTFVSQIENSTDTLLFWKEVESQFIVLQECSLNDSLDNNIYTVQLSGGSDYNNTTATGEPADKNKAYELAQERYKYYERPLDTAQGYLLSYVSIDPDATTASMMYYREWLFSHLTGFGDPGTGFVGVLSLLKDKLSYNPNRIIASGWDDQDICYLLDDDYELHPTEEFVESPLHLALMDVAYHSRCATALIDIPRSLSRAGVYDREDVVVQDGQEVHNSYGYVNKLARYVAPNTELDVNGRLYQTHSAIFAPWGKYQYVGTGKQNIAPPSFQALMIQRAQILNQAIQYEWALPTNRKHNLRLGKLAYNVPKKYLDRWQKLEGVGVNVITQIPDLGVNLWGNSTLFEVPPATYQALANLSTRYLVNAVEDVAYRVGISITFQYNNDQAYNKFYAGVTPLLDTMKNVGAIDDYYVKMAADIDGLDQVNANTVIGKIYLVINGVINDIYIDLIALPPGTDLNQYRS